MHPLTMQDIVQSVFQHFSGVEICIMKRVCKVWNTVATLETVWKAKVSTQFPLYQRTIHPDLTFHQNYMQFLKEVFPERKKTIHRRNATAGYAANPIDQNILWQIYLREARLAPFECLKNIFNFHIHQTWQYRLLLLKILESDVDKSEGFFHLFAQQYENVMQENRNYTFELETYWIENYPRSLLEFTSVFCYFPNSTHLLIAQKIAHWIEYHPAYSFIARSPCELHLERLYYKAQLKKYCRSLLFLRLQDEPGQQILKQIVNLLIQLHKFELIETLPIESSTTRKMWFEAYATLYPVECCSKLNWFDFNSFDPNEVLKWTVFFLQRCPDVFYKHLPQLALSAEQRKTLAFTLVLGSNEDCERFFDHLTLFQLTPLHLEEVLNLAKLKKAFLVVRHLHQIPFNDRPSAQNYLQSLATTFRTHLDEAVLHYNHHFPFQDGDFQYEFLAYALKHELWLCCIQQIWRYRFLSQIQRLKLAQQLLTEPPAPLSDVQNALCKYLPFFGLNAENRALLFTSMPQNEKVVGILKEKHHLKDTHLPPLTVDPLSIATHSENHSLPQIYDFALICLMKRKKKIVDVLPALPLRSLEFYDLLVHFIDALQAKDVDIDTTDMLVSISKRSSLLGMLEAQKRELALRLIKLIPHQACQTIASFGLSEKSLVHLILQLLRTEQGREAYQNHWWNFALKTPRLIVMVAAKAAICMPFDWSVDLIRFYRLPPEILGRAYESLAGHHPIQFLASLPCMGILKGKVAFEVIKALRDVKQIYSREEFIQLLKNNMKYFQLSDAEWSFLLKNNMPTTNNSIGKN